jgi:DnaJ-class molecular chaperone|mmetsp:Transcript_27720/g.46957  ORF Transcript_27720/g.46957 Transcript_27720/m.46957 type:complete len:124 (-) Transcript_27720:512-883(-)
MLKSLRRPFKKKNSKKADAIEESNCKKCKGTGNKKPLIGAKKMCKRCGGTGRVLDPDKQEPFPCEDTSGAGRGTLAPQPSTFIHSNSNNTDSADLPPHQMGSLYNSDSYSAPPAPQNSVVYEG